jgi:ligand-binding sensor domain-containing protein
VIRWNPDGDSTVLRATPGDDRGLGTAPISAILASSKGRVWIGSDGDGLLALDPGTGKFTRYRYAAENPGTISDDHITVLFEDRSKNLWIGTTNGLNRLDPSGRMVRFQHQANEPTSLSFDGVESIHQDAGGVMWVGGFTVGVCKFDELRLRLGYHRTRSNTTSIFEDTDGTLWAGTYNDGLYKYERAAQRVTTYHGLRQGVGGGGGPINLESAAWIAALHRDRHGTLWISLRGRSLIGFDTKTETYRQYVPDPETPNSLPVDTIYDIWEDDRGMLWLATWGGGLVRFDPQLETFTSFNADAAADPTGLSSDHLYTLYPDPADKQILWIGTAKGGLVRFNIISGTATSFRHRDDDPMSLSHDDVTTIYRDPSGIVRRRAEPARPGIGESGALHDHQLRAPR